MRLPPELLGKVESLKDDTAVVRLSDGETRTLAIPEQLYVETDMSVRIQVFPDGSAPIVMWGT